MLSYIIRMKRYWLWRNDYAKYILENNMKIGVELGVKSGQSFKSCLELNPDLILTGVDNWQTMPNSPYAKSDKYDKTCRKRLAKFGSRAILMKADAIEAANSFEDLSLDFVFHDLFNYRVSTVDFHKCVFRAWFPKLKQDGQMICGDFPEPDISNALKALGYSWEYCIIGMKQSPKLGCVKPFPHQ
jgi:hypothetical protein